MIEITKLFEKCLNLHKGYNYTEEKEILKKFIDFDSDKVLKFIGSYSKNTGYEDRIAEVFHSLSCILAKSQKNNSIMALEKAIELDPSKSCYYEELSNKLCNIDLDQAIVVIKKAIQLNPNKKSLHEDLIILLEERGLNGEASKITELVHDFPKNLLCVESYIENDSTTTLLGLEN